MPPTVVLIRHAQALHNVDNKCYPEPLTRDYSIHDPVLSELGREQCTELRKNISKRFRNDVEDAAIIVSPMLRTMETAHLALGWLINKGVKVEADALWQENSDKPCDTGSPVERLQKEYPDVDYSGVDPVWPDKTSPAGAKYRNTRQGVLARGRSALASLHQRPEKIVFVVSHSGFLRLGLTGYWFFNADYRVFDLEDAAATGDPVKGLKQWESTLKGGLGWSRDNPVELGVDDALPDEDINPPVEK